MEIPRSARAGMYDKVLAAGYYTLEEAWLRWAGGIVQHFGRYNKSWLPFNTSNYAIALQSDMRNTVRVKFLFIERSLILIESLDIANKKICV